MQNWVLLRGGGEIDEWSRGLGIIDADICGTTSLDMVVIIGGMGLNCGGNIKK